MAVSHLTGFEGGHVALDGWTALGTLPTISTLQVRTGTYALRCNKASGVASGADSLGNTPGWVHFGLYIATLPTLTIQIARATSGVTLFVTSSGKLRTTAAGSDSSATLVTGQWYWIGIRGVGGAFTGPFVQVDGIDDLSGTQAPVSDGEIQLGCPSSAATTLDAYYDDLIVDSAGFIASSKVAMLVPTADSAVGAGWTLGSGGTSGLWDALNNEPPTAGADPGTTVQIRNATANANTNYDATMTTYTVAGIGASDTILAVRPVVVTAAPVTTSAKAGTVGVVSNPAITNIALAAGGTAGAFWSGVAAAAYPTGWKTSLGTLTASPSVALGTAPVMRITQVTSSTRIAMVGFMGINVAWTPGAGGAVEDVVPYVGAGYYA